MPTGIELYGQTSGLSETTLTRLQTGFDGLRAYEGWEEYRIPSFVWNYIGADERDRILAWLETAIYDNLPTPFIGATGASKDEYFAFCYVVLLFAEWWRDLPLAEKPEMSSLFATCRDYIGVPESVLYTRSLSETTVQHYWPFPNATYYQKLGLKSLYFRNDLANNIYCSINIGESTSYPAVQTRLLANLHNIYAASNYYREYYPTTVTTYIEDWDDVGIAADWPKRPRVMVVWA